MYAQESDIFRLISDAYAHDNGLQLSHVKNETKSVFAPLLMY